jgi:hypothetical protein
MKHAEHVVWAAFKDPHTGIITTGATHGDAFAASTMLFTDLTEDEFLAGEGFVTSTGRYIKRVQAWQEFGGCNMEMLTGKKNHETTSARNLLRTRNPDGAC